MRELISSLSRHVFRDLRPYVCTFDSCTKPNHLFETRHDWYDHEVQHHRREWYCAECTVTFSTSSGFTHHLKEIHRAFLRDERDVSALVGGCERAMSGPQQCPLCVGRSEHASQQLRSHLGRHMQQLALFTLPRLEIGEENLPSEAGLIGRESSDEEAEEEVSGLEFDSNPSEGSPGEDDEESRWGGGVKEKDEAREAIPLLDKALYECPHSDCPRKGENGFLRKDNMIQHQRLVHNTNLPKRERRRGDQKSGIVKK